MKKMGGFDEFERVLREEKREKERRAEVNRVRTRSLIATAAVATLLMLGINKCLSSRVTAPVAETKLVEEEPKTYLAASGTVLRKYLDQDIAEDVARFVVIKNGNGTVEQVLIGTNAGSHWNINACNADQTYGHLYSVQQGGSKDTQYAGIYDGDYCHIGYGKDGEVVAVSVTKVAAEKNPVAGFKSCPSSVECYLFTVKSKWVPTTSTEPTPSNKDMDNIDGYWDRERANDAQESFDRKWAEGQVEDLKTACRMGQKHWTLCPDGYDKH